jgi:hypothetical protein
MRQLLSISSVALLIAALTGWPARAADEVVYQDRAAPKGRARVVGPILEESPQGVRIKTGKDDVVLIPAGDILEIDYQTPSNVPRIEFHRPFNREDDALKSPRADDRRRLLAEAVRLYRGLLPQLAQRKEAQRYVEFRLAQLVARRVEEDPSLRDEALTALRTYQSDHPDSWEIVPCSRQLARLYESQHDWAGAQQVYEDLAHRPGLGVETKRECNLAVLRYLLRRKQHAQAESRVRELLGQVPADDPLTPRLQVYQAECQVAAGKVAEAEKELTAVLRGPADPAVKAAACNTLAEGYRLRNQPEEAFWQYLWVDVVYPQDAEEHARALYHLARLFEQVKKDPTRGRQCRDRLLKDKEFAGTEYQALAAGEK